MTSTPAAMALTFGFHSRIDDRVQKVVSRVNVGNLYINRNQIGAVVGSQPFGGHGLSGTGPKAGGPRYVPRFAPQKPLRRPRARSPPRMSLSELAQAFAAPSPRAAPNVTEGFAGPHRRIEPLPSCEPKSRVLLHGPRR